jgi:creatinine amidohydrolase
LTLKPETMIQYLVDVAWSFSKHGVKRILFINGHGGNRPVLELACTRIRHELGMLVGWAGLMGDVAPDVVAAYAKTKVNGHSCEIETSQLLYVGGEDSIRKEALRAATIKMPAWNKSPIKMPRGFDEITERGDLGDATQYSMEIGRAVTEAVKERLIEAIEQQMLSQPV